MSTVPEYDEQRRSRSPLLKLPTSEYTIGICLLLFVVLLWTASNFVTQYVLVGGYPKPFMVTYVTTATFTLYLLPSYLRKLLRKTPSRRGNTNYQPLPQEHGAQLPVRPLREADDRLTPEETAKLALYYGLFWFAGNWTLNASLIYTSVASATILTGMCGIFTLVVGRMFHVETLTLIKIAAVLSSFTGVALVSLSDSTSSSATTPSANTLSINVLAVLGDILALLSALFYALNTIFVKVQVREESRIDAQLLFGYAGLFNILLWWPAALLLHWFGMETLEFPSTKELILGIVANMFITLLNDYLYVIAMLKTTPLVVTVGLTLTIPLAVVGDYFLGKFATLQMLVGAVLVTGGFVVVGVKNSKQKEEERLLVRDPADQGIGQRAHPTVPLVS